jgi:hypothetical protein
MDTEKAFGEERYSSSQSVSEIGDFFIPDASPGVIIKCQQSPTLSASSRKSWHPDRTVFRPPFARLDLNPAESRASGKSVPV